MTFAHPGASARPATARIRILGQEPPPPRRRRRPNWTLLAACVVVAGVGVWTTLELRPQSAEQPFPATPVTGSIDVMGIAVLSARQPDTHAVTVLHRVHADYAGAARVASRRQTVPAHTPVVTQPWTPTTPATGTRPASTAVPAQDVGSPGTPTTIGPEQPPNPAAPNTALDPS